MQMFLIPQIWNKLQKFGEEMTTLASNMSCHKEVNILFCLIFISEAFGLLGGQCRHFLESKYAARFII